MARPGFIIKFGGVQAQQPVNKWLGDAAKHGNPIKLVSSGSGGLSGGTDSQPLGMP